MNNEIVNRVANSDLITIDLADYFPKQAISICNLKDFLFEGVMLKEKEFRLALKKFNFSIYSEKIVALQCPPDLIIPMWAFMLITCYLNNVDATTHFGTKEDVFQKLFLQNIEEIDVSEFENKKVIIKGCGDIKITEAGYIAITKKLHGILSSLMFGEACSAVPISKKK